MSTQLHKNFTDARLNHFLKNIRKKKSNLITSCKYLKLKEVGSSNY